MNTALPVAAAAMVATTIDDRMAVMAHGKAARRLCKDFGGFFT